MKLLLDTHIFLWYITEDNHLNAVWDQMITDPRNQVFLSVVSYWEIIIKYQTGNLPLPEAPEIYVPKLRQQHQISVLSVDEADVACVAPLLSIHRDPFDRLLVAQAQRYGLTFVTVDANIRAYPNLLLL